MWCCVSSQLIHRACVEVNLLIFDVIVTQPSEFSHLIILSSVLSWMPWRLGILLTDICAQRLNSGSNSESPPFYTSSHRWVAHLVKGRVTHLQLLHYHQKREKRRPEQSNIIADHGWDDTRGHAFLFTVSSLPCLFWNTALSNVLIASTCHVSACLWMSEWFSLFWMTASSLTISKS